MYFDAFVSLKLGENYYVNEQIFNMCSSSFCLPSLDFF